MSFKIKTILGIAVIETALLLILIFTVLNFLRQTQTEELSKRITIANQLLTTTSQDAMISSDLATLDNIVHEFIKNPGIIYIRMLDKEGRVLTQSGQVPESSTDISTDINHEDIEKTTIVHTRAEITAHNVNFGVIETGYSTSHFSEFFERARSQTLAIAVTEIILVAIFSFFLGTYLTAQLGSLKAATEKISSGDYNVNIQVKGNDEIASTVNAFNQMAARLDKLWREQNASYKLIETIQDIQFEFINTTDTSKFFSGLLNHVLELTESHTGFIATVEYNGTQQYLNCLAFTDSIKNLLVSQHGQSEDGTKHELHDIQGIFGHSTLSNRIYLVNSHHSLGSLMGIPLMHGDDIIGVLGLANRTNGYTQETADVYDLIWKSIANILYAYRSKLAQEYAQQELSERETFLTTLFNNVFDSIITIDELGVITNCNEATTHIFGYNKSELLAKNIKILMPEPFKSMHDFYLENYRKKPRTDSKVIMKTREIVAITRDGYYIPIELSVNELDSIHGPTRYIGIIRDITNQKKYIEALQLANTKARETARAKTDFLTMMSTEIRSPIRKLLEKLNELDITSLPDTQGQQLRTAFDSSHLILDIIDEVIDFSKIDNGEIILNESNFDLHALIEDTCDRYAAKFNNKQISLTIDYPASMERYFLSDQQRIGQVLSKILSNAIKYTPEGSITVRVNIDDTENNSADVTIDVIDTGIGIKPHKLKAIFEPFSRVNNAYTHETAGSGLGLAISKRIIEFLGGTITAQSKQGQGSTFHIRLTLAKASPQ